MKEKRIGRREALGVMTGDNIFADSLASELATVSGDPTSGYTATFRIGVAV